MGGLAGTGAYREGMVNLLHHEPKVTLWGVTPKNVIAWHAGQ